jgi:hypothetical protein
VDLNAAFADLLSVAMPKTLMHTNNPAQPDDPISTAAGRMLGRMRRAGHYVRDCMPRDCYCTTSPAFANYFSIPRIPGPTLWRRPQTHGHRWPTATARRAPSGVTGSKLSPTFRGAFSES